MNEEDAEKCAVAGYSCQLCRPPDVPAPHVVQLAIEASKKLSNPSPPPSPPEYSGLSTFSNANYVVDNVVLSERGMITLKAQTLEREKPKRRKRTGMPGEMDKNAFDAEPGVGGSADNSMENDPDDDEDLMPPPTPGDGSFLFTNLFSCTRKDFSATKAGLPDGTYICIPKISLWVYFGGPGKLNVGMFHGHLEYFMANWYIWYIL
jgi:hypothetical protein